MGLDDFIPVLEKLLEKFMFEAPYEERKTVKSGKKEVDEVFQIKEKSENLNDYIL